MTKGNSNFSSKRDRESSDLFSKLAGNSQLTLTEVSGRHKDAVESENYIVLDIIEKLQIKHCELNREHCHLLDLGAGVSNIALGLIEHFQGEMTFVDNADVIQKLKSLVLKKNVHTDGRHQFNFVEGYFPNTPKIFERKYQKILLYSMIQYTDTPLELVDQALGLLDDNGIMLIGDIPNVNKKGRFLSSEFGTQFHCDYTKTPLPKSKTLYENQFEFLFHNGANHYLEINDQFIFDVLRLSRLRGFDAYVMPQPKTLPFSQTREDILIYAPRKNYAE